MVGRLRRIGLYKSPGISETITWARALAALGLTRLDTDAAVATTLGSVLKDPQDIDTVSAMFSALVADAARHD
jgi:hypothetical protein